MLDPKYLLENIDSVEDRLGMRGDLPDLDAYVAQAEKKKGLLRKVEDLRSRKNKASDEVSRMKKEGRDASHLIAEMRDVGDDLKTLENDLRALEDVMKSILLTFPNLPDLSVPPGAGPEGNLEVRKSGPPPTFNFPPRPHWDIGEALGLLDFERAGKIAGSRFVVSLRSAARLERALMNFMLDIHVNERGFTEILPPFIANAQSLTGTGNLPKFREDLFRLESTDLYMIPTAEVPLTNYYRNEILDAAALPRRFAAWTPCFRSEAGSYGKDIRGLVRQHQFNKVEMMVFSNPESSGDELERMTASAEEVLRRLGLAYRVVLLCAGDMGFASSKTYDLEVWMPGREGYMEISSCSNCTDFQARRCNIRFRRAPKSKPEFVHTLNGSGLAVGRTTAAILENYQKEDGSVEVPEALRPYMNGLERITKETP